MIKFIKRYIVNRKQKQLLKLKETITTKSVISTVDSILRNSNKIDLEYNIKPFSVFDFKASTDYFINNTYIYILTEKSMFRMSKIASSLENKFFNDKFIIITTTSNLEEVKVFNKCKIIEFDTIESIFSSNYLFKNEIKIRDFDFLRKEIEKEL